MTPDFIPIERRFRDLTNEELAAPEVLAAFDHLDIRGSLSWTELLDEPRVLVLAEAGSGKTKEMQSQAERLVRDGKHAFFVALEGLVDSNLSDLLDPTEEDRFQAWLADGATTAWFFLDAVDELKLVERGSLDRALTRLAKALSGHSTRVRLIVSCRPSDWRPEDATTLAKRFPLPLAEVVPPPPAELFIEALSERSRKEKDPPFGEGARSTKPSPVRCVVLSGLTQPQIEDFARARGVTDTHLLMAEIRNHNAWPFVTRPLDLLDVIDYWLSHGQLGTKQEQHEQNIANKLRDDRSHDKGALSDGRARLGAEWLALALFLGRARTIRVGTSAGVVLKGDASLASYQTGRSSRRTRS
jgi:hypothetical protein